MQSSEMLVMLPLQPTRAAYRASFQTARITIKTLFRSPAATIAKN